MTVSVTVTNPIVLSYYLGLEGKRWWQFKDANTGTILKVQCSQSSAEKMEVDIKSEKIDAQNFLTLEGSEFWGQKIHWVEFQDKQLGHVKWSQGGIHFPYGWKPGDTIVGVTEGSVLGFGKATLTLRFANFTQLRVPSWSPLPQTHGIFTPYGDDTELNNTAVIEVKTELKISSGPSICSGSLFFAYGIGIVAANLNLFGIFLVLDLQKWGKQ